jgi:branched-chain amino acid aminotransferase
MITYVSGRYLPHDQAVVSVDDRGLIFGDAVFDIGRTFRGEPFKLESHLQRLYRSMRYVELDADMLLPEIREATSEVLARNTAEIEAAGDVFYEQIITRGPISPPGSDTNQVRPTVIVKLRPLPFGAFAPFYENGVDLHVSLLTLPFAGPMDPRAKAANRLSNTRPELKGERASRDGNGHWTLIFNSDGTIAETHAANIAVVQAERLMIPPPRLALGGISLETLCELAPTVGLQVVEQPLTTYDLLNADETLMTATSFSILPVAAIDGIKLRMGGRFYPRLLKAWTDLVGFDFVEQARRRAGGTAAVGVNF